MSMEWTVELYEEFEPEFDGYSEAVQDAILAKASLFEREVISLVAPMLTR